MTEIVNGHRTILGREDLPPVIAVSIALLVIQ